MITPLSPKELPIPAESLRKFRISFGFEFLFCTLSVFVPSENLMDLSELLILEEELMDDLDSETELRLLFVRRAEGNSEKPVGACCRDEDSL